MATTQLQLELIGRKARSVHWEPFDKVDISAPGPETHGARRQIVAEVLGGRHGVPASVEETASCRSSNQKIGTPLFDSLTPPELDGFVKVRRKAEDGVCWRVLFDTHILTVELKHDESNWAMLLFWKYLGYVTGVVHPPLAEFGLHSCCMRLY